MRDSLRGGRRVRCRAACWQRLSVDQEYALYFEPAQRWPGRIKKGAAPRPFAENRRIIIPRARWGLGLAQEQEPALARPEQVQALRPALCPTRAG